MKSQSIRKSLSLLMILFVALILRLIGIQFGLPDVYHADEPIVVNHALAYGSGDFNPHFFKIPPLVSYLLFFCYGVYYLLGRAVGIFSDLEAFQNLFLSDPTSFYLIGRVIFGALCGTATIYVFYRLLERFFSREHAHLGSLFLALAFLHVRDSHYVYCDIPLVLVLVAAYVPIFRILHEGHRRDYMVFGIALGLATATKYNGIFLLVPFFLAHLLQTKRERFGVRIVTLLMTGVAALLTYGLLNPYSWLDFTFFVDQLRGQAGAEGFTGFFHHLTYSLNGGVGFLVLLFAGIGFCVLLIRLDSKRVVLFSFVCAYYLVLCFFSQPYDRYVLPLIPVIVFFAADGLLLIKQKFRLSGSMMFFLVSASMMPNAAKIYLSDALFLKKDVRSVARQWIERHIPQESKVALDIPFYMPRLKPSVAQLKGKRAEILEKNMNTIQIRRLDLMIREAAMSPIPRYQLFFMKANLEENFLFSKPALPYDLEYLKASGIQYVILSHVREGYETKLRKSLEANGELLSTFNPYKNPAREWAVDKQPLTGSPFLWKDLVARKRNGQFLKLYRLR